jgi:Zn-dependent oligopeptidase
MQNTKLDLSWANLSEKEITEITTKIVVKLNEFKEEIKKIDNKDLGFENLIHREEVMSAEIGRLEGGLFGYVNLHTDPKIQNVARKVELELSKILSEFVYDKLVYEKFINYYKGNFKKEKKTLTGEQIKIVEDANKGYKKIGMHLDDKSKNLLLSKKNRMSKLAQEFDLLLVENYKKGMWLKKEELAGIPEENFANFKYDEKKKKYFRIEFIWKLLCLF